jgi:hypothetical protein
MISKAGLKETILEAEIDLTEVGRWQEQEPIFPYRRPLLYREIINRHRAETVVTESQIREAETISMLEKDQTKVARIGDAG